MTCQYADWDGAYVLGSLSSTERLEYAEHLATCEMCSASVQRLAGLPGLLSRVPAAVLEDPTADEPVQEQVPVTVLPNLIAQVRRESRRRTWAVRGLVAAAVLAIALGAGAVARNLSDDAPVASQPVVHAEPMSPVGDTSMTAQVALTRVGWGTRIDLSCSYPAEGGSSYPGSTDGAYAMYVQTSAGDIEEVATWKPLPGRSMRLTAATSVERDDITSVVIRTASGQDVLKLIS